MIIKLQTNTAKSSQKALRAVPFKYIWDLRGGNATYFRPPPPPPIEKTPHPT